MCAVGYDTHSKAFKITGKRGFRTLAETLGIAPHVHFAGHTTRPESWVAAFDIFALSSDTEQMPLSLLEAMAAGLPCVSTNVGDVADMLAPANRDFITPPDALAGALIRMLAADRPAIGAANKAKAAADYDQQTMFAAHTKILHQHAQKNLSPHLGGRGRNDPK